MRALGWIWIVLGLAGVVACVVAVVAVRDVGGNLARGATALGAQARSLLATVDERLAAVPARVRALTDRRGEDGDADGVGDGIAQELARLEEALAATHAMATRAVRLLEVATVMRGDEDVSTRFPRVVAVTDGLAGARDAVAVQRADLDAWTLRAAWLQGIVDGVRADLAATRTRTESVERDVLDGLGAIILLASVFLAWMALGQIALALLGRRATRGGAAA